MGRGKVTYYFYWGESNQKTGLFFKVGQYPELEEVVIKSLRQALNADDLKMYKNALRLRNFNLGIAAIAYMRRVVENRMGDMLEVLHEAAVAHNAPSELLARHAELMKEKRFSVKVEYAGNLLPENLRPAGKPNPMAILHELASDGLHAKSDAECSGYFRQVPQDLRVCVWQDAHRNRSRKSLREGNDWVGRREGQSQSD